MDSEAGSQVETEASLLNRLEQQGIAACREIITLCNDDDAIACELQDKFHPAVADITRIEHAELSPHEGAFVVQNGTLALNLQPVLSLMHFTMEDIRARILGSDVAPEPREIMEAQNRVFLVYLLHELRHRTQGIGAYGLVGQLKNVAGRESMAKLDLAADRDAAYAFAAITAGKSDRRAFLEAYKEALFYSGAYYFKVFSLGSGRPDKTARAIGNSLMCARFAHNDHFDDMTACVGKLPLETSLYVELAPSQDRLVLFQGEPSSRVLGIANDGQTVSRLVAAVNDGDFDDALVQSYKLMKGLRLVE
jgi:hypothetical protein